MTVKTFSRRKYAIQILELRICSLWRGLFHPWVLYFLLFFKTYDFFHISANLPKKRSRKKSEKKPGRPQKSKASVSSLEDACASDSQLMSTEDEKREDIEEEVEEDGKLAKRKVAPLKIKKVSNVKFKDTNKKKKLKEAVIAKSEN